MPQTDPKLLRAIKRERLHVERRLLEDSPHQVRRRFAHAWAPADFLLEKLGALPAGLLDYWLAAPAGHVVLSAGVSAYVPGALPWHGSELHAVARIAAADLLDNARPALMTVAHLIDHLLGSRGVADGTWLSDGAGSTPRLRRVGEQLASLVRLGYGPAEPHAYFAWAFSGYWLDRQALNVADPHVERLLRTTICSATFWEAPDDG